MLISNKHIRTYYFRSSRTGNHPTLGSREKLPPAIGTTRPNYSDGSRWNLQPRYSFPPGDFPSYSSTLAAAFLSFRCTGLEKVAPRPGRIPKISQRKIKAVEATLETTPPHATHWSTQTNLKPHLVKTFKLSRDKHFVEKLYDIAGLYLNPPDKSLVLCVDEKSQIQALDRTQPGLPIKKGRCQNDDSRLQTQRHDHLVYGLKYAGRQSYRRLHAAPRHWHQEFIRFLKQIDRETPFGLDLHLIVDNYGTHKHPRMKSWLKRHPRFHLHFTPTSSSWLNLVERWFREITDKRIRRSSFQNVSALIKAIKDYLENHNQNPKIFIWNAPVERILAKIAKCKEVLDALH